MSNTPGIKRVRRPCASCHKPHNNHPHARCQPCQKRYEAQHNADRAHYHTPAWERTRKTILTRDHHQCVVCTGTYRLAIHHVVARRNGGTDTPRNLVTLCHYCHNYVENNHAPTLKLLREHLQHSPHH